MQSTTSGFVPSLRRSPKPPRPAGTGKSERSQVRQSQSRALNTAAGASPPSPDTSQDPKSNYPYKTRGSLARTFSSTDRANPAAPPHPHPDEAIQTRFPCPILASHPTVLSLVNAPTNLTYYQLGDNAGKNHEPSPNKPQPPIPPILLQITGLAFLASARTPAPNRNPTNTPVDCATAPSYFDINGQNRLNVPTAHHAPSRTPPPVSDAPRCVSSYGIGQIALLHPDASPGKPSAHGIGYRYPPAAPRHPQARKPVPDSLTRGGNE